MLIACEITDLDRSMQVNCQIWGMLDGLYTEGHLQGVSVEKVQTALWAWQPSKIVILLYNKPKW